MDLRKLSLPGERRFRRVGLALLATAVAGVIGLVVRAQLVEANRDAWGRVRETGVFRVGVDASYPPFASLDAQGEIVGLDADLARALGPEIGASRVELVNMGYDGLYEALRVDQVDGLISALVVDPTRTADVSYSISYFDAGQVFVIPTGASRPVSLDELSGVRLAVELGSEGDVQARQQTRRVTGLEILSRPSTEEALRSVSAGEADAALVDAVSAHLHIASHPEVRIAGSPVTSEKYSVVVRRTSTALLEAINRALIEMRDDGRLEEITDRWIGR